MIPKSCPLNDKYKLSVTLHVECKFIRHGDDYFKEMCKDCPFNPEVILQRTMTPEEYKRYYKKWLKLCLGAEVIIEE